MEKRQLRITIESEGEETRIVDTDSVVLVSVASEVKDGVDGYRVSELIAGKFNAAISIAHVQTLDRIQYDLVQEMQKNIDPEVLKSFGINMVEAMKKAEEVN